MRIPVPLGRRAAISLCFAAILPAALFAACGDDDDKGSVGSAIKESSGSGTDESYVASVCKSMNAFSVSLEKAIKDNPNVTDPAKVVDILSKPIDTLTKDLKAAKPPADVKDYHNKVVSTFEQAAKALKDKKDPNVFGDFDPPKPPDAVAARLKKAAESNKDCQAADFNFGQ